MKINRMGHREQEPMEFERRVTREKVQESAYPERCNSPSFETGMIALSLVPG